MDNRHSSKLLVYIDEISEDVKVDELSVKETQMRLPAIKHKWVGRLMRHKAIINSLYGKKIAYKKAAAEKMKESTMYNVSEAAFDKLVNKQESIVDIDHEIKEHQLIVELLEKTEKIFNSFTFDIKNLVEIMKMETM